MVNTIYICPKCHTTFTTEEAIAADYYCNPCKRYLCAQAERPATILAVPAIAPEPEQAETPAAPPPSLADQLSEAVIRLAQISNGWQPDAQPIAGPHGIDGAGKVAGRADSEVAMEEPTPELGA